MQQITLWQAPKTTTEPSKKLTEREIIGMDISDIESCARLAARDLLSGAWTVKRFQEELYELITDAHAILTSYPASWTVGLDFTIERLQEAQAAALDGDPRVALRATIGASVRTLPICID